MDEDEGLPLFHQQRDPVREGADQLRAAHSRQRLDAGHRPTRVEAEEALTGSEPGGRDDLVGREQALPHYLDQRTAGLEQALISGLVFGTIFARTGRIFLLMAAHAAFDLTALVLIYFDCEPAVAHFFFK